MINKEVHTNTKIIEEFVNATQSTLTELGWTKTRSEHTHTCHTVCVTDILFSKSVHCIDYYICVDCVKNDSLAQFTDSKVIYDIEYDIELYTQPQHFFYGEIYVPKIQTLDLLRKKLVEVSKWIDNIPPMTFLKE